MKEKDRRELIRLIKRGRIQFHHPDDPWPQNHQHVFRAVHQAGQYQFENYAQPIDFDSHRKPWRVKTKLRASRIAGLARDCYDDMQNEAGWRLKLESEILARFTTDVTCKRCSSKLWRSEVEVLLGPLDKFRDILDLERRQSSREPCNCSQAERSLDWTDNGICRIFHDRTEERIKYCEDDPMAKELPKGEKPDRVFGLRQTSRFETLLDEEVQDPKSEFYGNLLRDALECGPFDEPTGQVLFPFLVLEAKRESGDSFQDLEIQTAFPIKKLLDVQFKLKSATRTSSQWNSGPFVWFLSHRGDEWRVQAAHLEMKDDELHYHVFKLWNGSIRSNDGALQLLLIVDYIFDWARDSFREAVLNELRILAGRNISSLADDSEVRSLAPRSFQAAFEQNWNENLEESEIQDAQVEDMFLHSESVQNKIRGISLAQARVSALYITKDNLKALLQSFSSKAAAQRHARDLLRLLREAWRVTPTALEELEFVWTSQRRDDPDLYGSAQSFITTFTISAFLSTDWEPVLELTYIALAEDALNDLKDYVDQRQPIHVYTSELPIVDQKHLVGYFRHFRQGSARSTFQAATKRCCFSSRLARDTDYPDNFFLVAEERFDEGIRYRMDVTMLPDSKPKGRQLVAAVYNSCKRGMRPPEEPFLRISSTNYSGSGASAILPSVWGLEELNIDTGILYFIIGCKTGPNSNDIKFGMYILDDIPGPTAFPIRSDAVESYLPLKTRSQKHISGWQREWNILEEMKPNQFTTEMLRQLHSQPDEHKTESELSEPERIKGSGYHATRELPPHLRGKYKIPEGHWVTPILSSDPYKDIYPLAVGLVARRHNVKLITCLYANPGLPGLEGLKSGDQFSDAIPQKPKGAASERRDRHKLREAKFITHIQRGDQFINAPGELRRRIDGDDLRYGEFMMSGGDWLTDRELEYALSQGTFPGSRPQKRGAETLEDDDQGPRKRQKSRTHPRVEELTSDQDDGSPAESSTKLEKASKGKEKAWLRDDYMSDEEFQSLVEANYLGALCSMPS